MNFFGRVEGDSGIMSSFDYVEDLEYDLSTQQQHEKSRDTYIADSSIDIFREEFLRNKGTVYSSTTDNRRSSISLGSSKVL